MTRLAGIERERAFVADDSHASRAPEARIRHAAGLGLGIVASVAVAHGGRAELRSAAGGGTEAVITLPIAPTTDMADADLASLPHARR